jgi:LAS superfamily LD-carboxypeptidase LdcB
MPTTSQTGMFDMVRQQAASQPRPRPKPKPKQTAEPSYSPGGGGGGNYSTAKGAVGARGAYGLEAGAGTRLQALQQAYRQQFGSDLPVLSGGRTYQEQVKLYNDYKAGRGNLAAKPGTSVHESGRAVDFGGPAHGYGKQQTWLAQNAPKFGWHWAGKNFSQVEPWHFEAMY